jgi:hypothetical protein
MIGTLLLSSLTLLATPADTTTRPPGVRAVPRTGEIVIDGVLDEAVWSGTPAITTLLQSSPEEGAPATESIEVRFAVDEAAIYVAARLFDRSPDSVMALRTRRDRQSQSDFFELLIDPLRDLRTGYFFSVSAAGVQGDGVLQNDNWSDNSWDGVWESRVQRDATGWTVEMRIPVSQLRLPPDGGEPWGVNVGRGIGRRNEVSHYVPRLRQGAGFVSRFAELDGLDELQPRRRLEVLPYITGRAESAPRVPGNPFRNDGQLQQAAGVDLRLGLGGGLQLDATLNPDFGQVEVDPAVVNLSDVENFFEERRPFFVEGSSTFAFGYGGANNFNGFQWVNLEPFYARRIGRAPQGSVGGGEHADVPNGVRILGATKLTGRVNGWNVGALGAMTERTFADVAAGSERWRAEVEPLTGYGVLRVQRDLAGGRHGIGLLGTLTRRDNADGPLADQLNRGAVLAGVDGWLTLDGDREWVLSGWGAWSRITGTPERMLAVQRGPTHYYQRPDAGHVSVDPTRTSLDGGYGRLSLNRQSGSVLFNAAVGAVTPGFDNNDLGFVGFTDLLNAHVLTGYRWTRPTRIAQSARVQVATFGRWDFDGNRTATGLWSNNNITWKNFSSSWIGTFATTGATNVRATRGGPAMYQPARAEVFAGWESDGRKSVQLGVNGFVHGAQQGASNGWGMGANIGWRPASHVTLSVGPAYRRLRDGWQYLRAVTDPLATSTHGRRYVFGELDQHTLSADIRANWIFSPTLSLELFAQPLVSSGRYTGVRELRTPGSFDFLRYGEEGSTIDRATGAVDPDGAGPAAGFNIGQPDFTLASLRGNAVLRWEYAPGAALFVVWTQDRAMSENVGTFRPGSSFEGLLEGDGRNVMMVKATYRLGR